MNFPRPFLKRTNIFRPAIDVLTDHFSGAFGQSSSAYPNKLRDDGTNTSTATTFKARSQHSRNSSSEVESTSGIPLIDYSRTPSPTPYRGQSAVQSEDEDDGPLSSSLRPLFPESSLNTSWWKAHWRDSGLGSFLFGSWAGWQVYVAALCLWHVSMSIMLVFFNRIILTYGIYKFPYPLTATWIQLVFSHVYLLAWASVSRWAAAPLRRSGLSALVAPSYPHQSQSGGARMLGFSSINPLKLIQNLLSSSGGISGGGLVEFDVEVVKIVLPLSLVFVGKVLLSNISFAYSALPLYSLCRLGIVPLTLILTSTLTRSTHSIPALSSALTAWLNLLMASIRSRSLVTWEAIVAGVFSILFVSLYPIALERTHKTLISIQLKSGDVLSSFSPARTASANTVESGSKQSTRAYYQLLHYNSLLSIILLSPMVMVSGELSQIFRNCYFLDVFWFWFICACGGFSAFAVYTSSLALVRATSPLTFNFIGIPKAATQILIFSNFRLPVHSWVGVVLCWLGTAWYTLVRREEGRQFEQRRLEGRS